MSPDADLPPVGGAGRGGNAQDGGPEKPGADGPIVLTVVIERSEWLRGAIAEGAGPPDQFDGWLGLMAVIERVRSSGPPAV